ncbi:hypothetical protein [Shewanella surugensis]|uniref:Uncharacterized protein n=1 Tax=Shewanella surugensis TaxID=212020 RepID=A0ABT0LGD1_9GAMM|nr:hypothetical protein [Shewanella surugensis]MCL1126743.1 hypothetical protein [Shewanella surugensis]
MMNEFNNLFSQTYLWLSLLGGLHCFFIAIYIRFFHQTPSENHKLLANILGLLAVYFFTGMINKHNAPIPIVVLFTLIIPIYFLLMPLLYLYCSRNVKGSAHTNLSIIHFYPAIMIVIVVIITLSYRLFMIVDSPNTAESLMLSTQQRNVIFIAFPGLLSLQAAFYFILIFNILNKFSTQKSASINKKLDKIKFKWLLILTFALMMNWLVRSLLIMLPFYIGDHISQFNLLLSRLILLLSLYILAFYGLKQVTDIAYIRGQKQALKIPTTTPSLSKEARLTEEEITFLQQVMNEDNR